MIQSAHWFRARSVLGGVLLQFLVVGAVHAGVQASGAISLIPIDETLEVGQAATLLIRFTNTSTNTIPPNEDNVAATLTGTTLVRLGCTTSACTTELPGTLSYQT